MTIHLNLKSQNRINLHPLHATSLVWDAHSCLPLNENIDISMLLAHKNAGATFVSVNVGMDMTPFPKIMKILASWRRQLCALSNQFILVNNIDDITQAQREGKLAVAFDLEGGVPLLDHPDMVDLFYDLNVRQIHLIYNRNNSIGGGCHDNDTGLTALGRTIVRRINEVGILMDVSHNGYRTSIDIIEASSKPVIFSHANPYGLVPHPRNIKDDQIDACAKTGGVIGINGISAFLGDAECRTETICNHIDYVVNRVGPNHVGIGLDTVYHPEFEDPLDPETKAYYWPESGNYTHSDIMLTKVAAPHQIAEITEDLLKRGYKEADVQAILGLNFFRVAQQSWTKI